VTHLDSSRTNNVVDLARAERAVADLLAAIGEDPSREGLRQTPARVARMYAEVLAGRMTDPSDHLRTTFEIDHDEVVAVRDIDFSSMCEHHLLPFFGHAHVAYLPGQEGRFTGLSKLARLVEGFGRRLQVQERMTSQIADALVDMLVPAGVLVMVEAEHTCMAIRGVNKPGTSTVTTAVRGCYRNDPHARAEVLALLGRR
jgi:GTP cyclohydrolase IA